MQKELAQIKKERWLKGTRYGDSILFYSMRCSGEDFYIKKIYGKEFSQNRLVVPKDGSTIRAIGLKQADKLDKKILKEAIKNPHLLIEKIQEDKETLVEIKRAYKNIKKPADIINLIELLQKHFFIFFYCVALGRLLFENKEKVKNKAVLKEVFEAHDAWRNSVFPKDKEAMEKIEFFLRKVIKKQDIEDKDDFWLFETKEVIKGLKDGFSKNLLDRIKKRKSGFVYLFLMGKSKVVETPDFVKTVEGMFTDKIKTDQKIIKGQTAYSSGKIVRGRAMIMNSAREKKTLKKGDVLVALQTNPEYLPLLKNVSAIIADEGGITGHGAIISREMKIPCIVGTKNARKIIKDGDMLEVDTATGTIKIIK